MIERKRLYWGHAGLFLVLAISAGCSSKTPAVVETPPPPVSVSQPVSREVIDYDDYEGRIAAVETVDVRARVRGHVIKVNFQDGQIVKAGDPLYEIDPRPYKASYDAALAQKAGADASLDLAKKEYDRASLLLRSRATSREEVDIWTGKQAVAKADQLKAQASVEQAKLDLDFTKIAAPINGKMSRTLVTAGNLINASGGETLLTTITSLEPMYVYFDVDERALARYRRYYKNAKNSDGSETSVKDLKIPIRVGLEGEEGFPHTGVIDFTENRVNSSTGTIQVRGVLSNKSKVLDAGMRARVRVPVSDPHKAIMATERAIGTDQGLKFVYVVNDQNVVERRDVKLDRLSDGLQGVGEGLKPADWVGVNGIQRVRDGVTVDPKRVPMPGTTAEPTKPAPKS
ncbi:efflux RND transporter periplasmic adaptor subunit [soil metagenome]